MVNLGKKCVNNEPITPTFSRGNGLAREKVDMSYQLFYKPTISKDDHA